MGRGANSDVTARADDFFWSATDEPHASRRKAILADHPEIKELAGYDWRSKYFVLLLVGTQLGLAALAPRMSWPVLLAVAYVIGGSLVQSLTLAIHELSHNLMFSKMNHNRLFSIFTNLPLVFAYAISFKKYHMDHHRFQGVDGVDTDIPTAAEGHFFTTPFRKALWVVLQVFFYALRPLYVKPYTPGKWEYLNWAVCLSFDAALVHYCGPAALGYLLLSMWLGLGPHVFSGHFIAEHYVFVEGQETYSYYGPLNFPAWFVGRHQEHHDFPRVPGSRLHLIKEIAPEYYDSLPQYTSWGKVLWDYVAKPGITPFSRVKRKMPTKKDL